MPSKIYPNRVFWFKNIPSGNPADWKPLQSHCFTIFAKRAKLKMADKKKLEHTCKTPNDVAQMKNKQTFK
jgi:hypothetical protein